MKTLNLEPFQATALQQNRLGAVLVEMDKQLGADFFITSNTKTRARFRQRGSRGNKVEMTKPFTPGETVELIEQLKTLSRHIADATITACEPVYLPELTEDQAKVLGVEPGLMATSEHTFLGGVYEWWIPRVWDAWAWLVRFDTQQKGA